MIYKLSIFIVIGCVAGLFIAAHFSSPPENLGINGGKLSLCPDSPNCVSSQGNIGSHSIPPIKAGGTTDQVMTKIQTSITAMGGTIIARNGPYLHAEFKSKWIRFVDDLECIFDESSGKIDIRSASRLGYSDLGVNRKRVEELRRLIGNE
ncbi:MAG TPA: DUF1499 domain-containing protein [Desulfovibrio sp.]|nr:DUF1499 domain-containing protein [Desulfovibrio sp.]